MSHHQTTVALVRDVNDLTLRQIAVLGLLGDDTTVRGVAAELRISKPAVTRSMDRLEALGLAKRGPDERDRRSVLLRATRQGDALLGKLT